MTKQSILEEAQSLVHGDRGEDYGHPYEDFSRTAGIWSALLGGKLKPGATLTPADVAMCMVGVKLSREVNKPKRDNRVDGAGYFETLDMVRERESEKARTRDFEFRFEPIYGTKGTKYDVHVELCSDPLIYLASPYSDPDPEVMERRFREACKKTAELMREGHFVFSPIAHSHPLVEHGAPTDWAYWEPYDKAILDHCDALWVLKLPGWAESVGVSAEIAHAEERGIPVEYVEP